MSALVATQLGRNGWTPGLYSLFRALFGVYLAVHLAQLVPYAPELFSSAGMLPDASLSPLLGELPGPLAWLDGPRVVQLATGLGVGLAVALGLGFWDRAAAIGLWALLTALFARNPLIANPSLPFVGWLLLAHAALPRRPYGAWHARSPGSEDAGWHLPGPIFASAWIVMALGYTYSGYTKLISPSWLDGSALAYVLENPLARPTLLRDALLALPPALLQLGTWAGLGIELAFAPLALFRRLRPYIWLALLGMHLGLIALIDFADLSVGMVFLHAFTFDPAWIPRARATDAPVEQIYYDGDCGFCHGSVRFILNEDRHGEAFRFAPLAGVLAKARISPAQRAALPDSLVVETASGELLTRSRAVLHIAASLGGVWRLVAGLGSLLSEPVRDALYDQVARIRRHLAPAPSDACPLAPREHRERFSV